MIGYPNVGKSSVINTLKKKAVCRSAPIPGETKVWQYVTLTKGIYLIDCPGIVPPDSTDTETQLVLKGVVRVEKLLDAPIHVPAVLERVREEYLHALYGTTHTEPELFLEELARKTGRLLKGGEPDLAAVSKIVLSDFQRGKLPFFVSPDSEQVQRAISGEKEQKQNKAQKTPSDSTTATSSSSSSSSTSDTTNTSQDDSADTGSSQKQSIFTTPHDDVVVPHQSLKGIHTSVSYSAEDLQNPHKGEPGEEDEDEDDDEDENEEEEDEDDGNEEEEEEEEGNDEKEVKNNTEPDSTINTQNEETKDNEKKVTSKTPTANKNEKNAQTQEKKTKSIPTPSNNSSVKSNQKGQTFNEKKAPQVNNNNNNNNNQKSNKKRRH